MTQKNLEVTQNVVEVNEEELRELTIAGGKGKGQLIKDGIQWTLEKSNDWCPTGACSSQC